MMGARQAAAALALLVAGCSATSHHSGAAWPAASADAFGQPVSAFLQATSGPGGGDEANDGAAPACAAAAGPSGQVQVAVAIADGAMQAVVMDALGRRLATLTQRGRAHTLRLEPGARSGLAGDELLVALQLTFWPLDALQAAAAGTLWHIAGGYRRELWYDGRRLATVMPGEDAGPDRWDGHYRFIDCRRGRRIDIQSTATRTEDAGQPTHSHPGTPNPP